MQEFELNRRDRETAAPRKPLGELTNRRYPLRGASDRASRFLDVATAAGPSKSRITSLRNAQENRRVVSDPVPGTRERRKFLDPIQEADNESAGEERPASGPRVRFRSKSATVIVPPFFKARGHIPTARDSDSNDQVDEDPSLGSSFSILGAPVEGERVKDMDDTMNTEEPRGEFEEAIHTPPPSPTPRQAAPGEPARRVKSVIDKLVPESHSTPAAVKPYTIPRRVSSPPMRLPTPEPPHHHPFDDSSSKGVEMPRPGPLDTSFLSPQTHKVTRGQLVILPSRTLLVDFREGERRQGRQGVEVLTISPDGEEVKINSRVTAISKLNTRLDSCVQRSAHE